MPLILLFGHRKQLIFKTILKDKGLHKKGTMHTLKKKRIQDSALVIGRSPSVAPVSSLRRKRFRAISEQRTRNESQRPRIKLRE